MRLRALTLAILLAAPGVAARAQLTAHDSLRLLDRARSAQAQFESYRRQELPRANGSEPSPCVYTIGRICYWNDDPGTDTPIDEPGSIRRARGRLVRTLAGLAERSRGDPWIVGEHVHYLVEAGNDSAAVVAARSCWAAAWWCAALRGYALHAGGRYLDAEAAFDSALAQMPPDTACRWRDLSLLLDDDVRDRYEKIPCAARTEFERRYWELADPSYAVPGNERRTEHFARMVLAALEAQAANAYGMTWGDDLREVLIRYGPSTWYVRPWSGAMFDNGMQIEGHDREPSYRFTPRIGPGDSVAWVLQDPEAREHWSPPYVDSMVTLDAQFAMFRRGDSALVVAVYADTGSGALLGVADPAAHAGGTRVAGSDALGRRVRRARSAWHGVVAGVERFDTSRRIDARARVWLAPPASAPGAPALSTLLLYTPDSSDVATVDDALSRALTSTELRGDRRVGVYWEVYGTPGARHDSARHDSAGHDSAGHDSVRADSARIDSANDGGVRADSGRVSMPSDSAQVDSTRGVSAAASPAVGPDSTRRDGALPARSAMSRSDSTGGVDTLPPPRPGISPAAPAAAGSSADTLATRGDVAITVTRIGDGLLSRVAQALHLAPRAAPLAVRWHDAALDAAGTMQARSVVLDLSQLPPGRYELALSVGPDATHRTTATREIRLR